MLGMCGRAPVWGALSRQAENSWPSHRIVHRYTKIDVESRPLPRSCIPQVGDWRVVCLWQTLARIRSSVTVRLSDRAIATFESAPICMPRQPHTIAELLAAASPWPSCRAARCASQPARHTIQPHEPPAHPRPYKPPSLCPPRIVQHSE